MNKLLLRYSVSLLVIALFTQAQKAEAQRAEVVGVVIEDFEGNKDGKVNPGETIKIRVQLKNIRNKTLKPSRVTLFTNQRGVRMVQGILKFPAIKPGETATARDPFVVAVGREVADNSIAFYLEVDRGKALKQTIPVSIEQPSQQAFVEVVRFDINDSEGGNKDGRVNPAERVAIRFYLKNTGQNLIPPSTTTLFTSQGGINIIDSLATFPGIAPGETVPSNDTYSFSVDDTVTASSAAFRLTGTFSPEGYATSACVPIFLDIFVCVDECAIIPMVGPTDTLMIRLSVCNRSMSSNPPNPPTPAPLPGVAVRILGITIIKCTTGSQLPNQPMPIMEPVPGNPAVPLNVIFYDTIAPNSCGEPLQCSVPGPKVKEFRFTIQDVDLSTPSCIWFTAEIWQNAVRSGTNCGITLPAAGPNNPLPITVYSRI